MARQDHYEVLGVTPEATPDEIRRAFRRLAAECHPDRNPGDRAASLRFKQINTAHQILSDPDARALYDDLTRGPDATRTGVDVPPPRPPPPDAPPQRPDEPPPEGSRSWSWRPGAPWPAAPEDEEQASATPPPPAEQQWAPPPPAAERASGAPWTSPLPAEQEHAPPPPQPPVTSFVPQPPPTMQAPDRVAHPGKVRRLRRAILRLEPVTFVATALALLAILLWPLGESIDVQALNVRTGQRIALPQEVIASEHAKGAIAFIPGTRVPATLDGAQVTLPAEQVTAAIASGRASLDFDPNGERKAERAAFKRGLSFGLWDWLAVEAQKWWGEPEGAERTRKVLEALQHDHPEASATRGYLTAAALIALNVFAYTRRGPPKA